MRTKQLPLSGQVNWDATVPERGYEVELAGGDDYWKPTLTVEPHTSELEYVFVQAADDKGAFTPGYAVMYCGIWSLPDELPVPTWMSVAIERAGFRYDPEPNSEKFLRERTERLPPEQTELVE